MQRVFCAVTDPIPISMTTVTNNTQETYSRSSPLKLTQEGVIRLPWSLAIISTRPPLYTLMTERQKREGISNFHCIPYARVAGCIKNVYQSSCREITFSTYVVPRSGTNRSTCRNFLVGEVKHSPIPITVPYSGRGVGSALVPTGHKSIREINTRDRKSVV